MANTPQYATQADINANHAIGTAFIMSYQNMINPIEHSMPLSYNTIQGFYGQKTQIPLTQEYVRNNFIPTFFHPAKPGPNNTQIVAQTGPYYRAYWNTVPRILGDSNYNGVVVFGPNGLVYRIGSYAIANPKITPADPDEPVEEIGTGMVYHPLQEGDYLPGVKKIETEGLWTDNNQILNTLHTGSKDHLDFHLGIYNKALTDPCAELQFEIFYADYDGKGAIDLGGLDNETMTKAMYSQFANILLPKGQSKFNINGVDQDYVYVIDVKRDRYKTAMDPGNWELGLTKLDPLDKNTVTNSTTVTIGTVATAVDTPVSSSTYVDYARINDENPILISSKSYPITLGTIEDGLERTNDEVDYFDLGIFYPNHGMLVLSGTKLDQLYGFATNRNIQKNGANTYRLWLSMQGVLTNNIVDSTGDKVGFRARNVNITYNKMYFVRVRNSFCNFSNNPTYVTGSEGVIIPEFKHKQQAYFTTIGLFTPNRELLAIGKLTEAVLSKATEESLFTVRIKH